MKKVNPHAAVITYSYFYRDSRAQRFAKALRELNYIVDVFALNEKTDKKYHFFLFPLARRRLSSRLWYFFEYTFFFFFVFIRLTVNQFKNRYKVIHVFNMPDFLVFSAILPKLFGAKIILDIRDLSPQLYVTKYHVEENHILKKCLEGFEKLSLEFSDVILSANQKFIDYLGYKYKKIRNNLYLSVECADPEIFYFRKKKQNKSFNIIYQGTMEERFAVDRIVDAIEILFKNHHDIELILIPKIVEEGKYLSSIKTKIANKKLGDRIKILSPLTQENLSYYLSESDIGLVLAVKDTYTDIIYRTKIYEFIACKIPIIATKTTYLADVFKTNQLYFLDNDTPECLAEAIFRLKENQELRKKLVQRAYEYYHTYNWENEKNKYKNLLSKMM